MLTLMDFQTVSFAAKYAICYARLLELYIAASANRFILMVSMAPSP